MENKDLRLLLEKLKYTANEYASTNEIIEKKEIWQLIFALENYLERYG